MRVVTDGSTPLFLLLVVGARLSDNHVGLLLILTGLVFVIEHDDGSVAVEDLTGTDGRRGSLSSMSFQMSCSALASGMLLQPCWVEITGDALRWDGVEGKGAVAEEGYKG